MKATHIIGAIGLLGWWQHAQVKKYLKKLVIKTGGYMKSEKGNSFFLQIQTDMLPNEKPPLLCYQQSKIYLLDQQNNIVVAVSKEINKNKSPKWIQEFIPVVDFEAIQNVSKINLPDLYESAKVEIVYKIIPIFNTTIQYTPKQILIPPLEEAELQPCKCNPIKK